MRGTSPIRITFTLGTLEVTGDAETLAPVLPWLQWDPRAGCHRAPAFHYSAIVLTLHRLRIPYDDQAKAFQPRAFHAPHEPVPHPHQRAALAAWDAAQRRGVVVLPTGAGKSLVARLAILKVQRDTLILVPTIDLMQQWHAQLEQSFGIPIGLLGGGERRVEPITVSTYDSGLLRMEQLGNRFGLLVCDECHHLPATSTRHSAISAIAPYRLGLSATPERSDGGEEVLQQLLGPICHRSEITELEGDYLAPYHLEQIPIHLDPDEREAYEVAYAHYRQFARDNGIRFSQPSGWTQFIRVCARSKEGRAAFAAYHAQKRLARASRAKLRMVWNLLRRHREERTILFTDDNATAYAIGETFFLPVLTHRTRMPERKALLAAFRRGEVPALVTSRVLNEGVDVPEVAVGIVVSGTGSVREHVQRLGRILRPREGKEAILYELVAEETAETFTSERRRQHAAYRRQGELSC